MIRDRFRIAIPHTETVMDYGPHTMETRHGLSKLWHGDSYPGQNVIDTICDNLPPRHEIVDFEGLKGRLGLVDTVWIERGESLVIQERSVFPMGWTSVDTVTELSYLE